MSNRSCCGGSYSHSHTHSHSGQCQCGCHSCSHHHECATCGSAGHCSCCGSHHHSQEDCGGQAKRLLQLADEAWMEVFKEKLMEHIRSSDHKIDELVEIVAEANRMRWHNKMSEQANCENYEKRLMELINQRPSSQGQSSNSGYQSSSNTGSNAGNNRNWPHSSSSNNGGQQQRGQSGYGDRGWHGEQGEGNKSIRG